MKINNKPLSFRLSQVALAISSAGLYAAVPLAVAEESAQQSGMEVIEVTANRRTQNIKEVPYNISAVSGQELENNQIIDASELLRNVPGITVVDRGYRNSGTVNSIIIRGINVDSGAAGDVPRSAVPTVSTYVNDTPIYANFILKDIEQVEVLRGPQGTLYGSGSLAGTVKYRMNRPDTDDFSGSVNFTYSQTEGSEGDNLSGDVIVNVPLGDSLAFRANFGKIDNDGIVDYTTLYELQPVVYGAGSVYANDEGQLTPVPANGDIATGEPVFTSKEDADTVDIDYGRVALAFDLTDNLNFLLSYQYQSDETGGRRQVTRGVHWTESVDDARVPTEYGEYENGAVVLEPSERDVSLTALEIEWNLGFATLTSSSSSYNNDGEALSDNSGFYAQQKWFTGLYYGAPRPIAIATRGYEEEAFVQELRLVSNEPVANMDWVVGFYYMDQDRKVYQDSFMPGYQQWANAAFPWWGIMGDFGMVYTDNDFHYVRDESFKDTALFGEVTYHFSDDFRATVGLRTFDNESDNDTVLSLPIWPFLGDSPSFGEDDNDTLFKANVSWDLGQSTMLYGTVSEGYRRGGANAVPLDGSLEERPEWQQYFSDSITNYEVGLKGYLGDNNHGYTASLFLMDWQDPQLNTASYWGFFTVANGDSAESQGLELDLHGYLGDDLRYVIGYAYVQAELTDDFYAPSSVFAENPEYLVAEDGDELPLTPEHTLSFSLDYTFSLDNGWYWITNANMYYQSESLNWYGDASGPDAHPRQMEIDAFTLFNASTRLSSENWDVSLYVKNITNEEGVTGAVTQGHMGTDPSESFYGNSSKQYISLPRTIGVSATYRF
ncbi:TonB-dependent receptor [Thalassotalea mangrovi]|uniref:TonB-dependent receptor n=1 Tax=Thalassotalea mangrovi TaxID=2572245 RepID=A0A4U1B515_9GAMM|nr:TonB-dependent receptor [Thalassotalea mangrovi]TKB45387.1 TonB-dependent receptor [Thalassotalea mangrovi]